MFLSVSSVVLALYLAQNRTHLTKILKLILHYVIKVILQERVMSHDPLLPGTVLYNPAPLGA